MENINIENKEVKIMKSKEKEYIKSYNQEYYKKTREARLEDNKQIMFCDYCNP